MGVEIRSNQITGITATVNSTDAVNKQYVDNFAQVSSSVENYFLYTDGSNSSFQPISGYTEYTSTGNYTFTVPTQATELFIEATGAGGGGASGNTDTSSFINDGIYWVTRTTGSNNINTLMYGGSIHVAGCGNLIAGTVTGQIITSTNSIVWVLRTSGNINGVNASNYNSTSSTYVVGGYGDLEWTQRTSGTTNTLFYNVQSGGVYDGTYFLICGATGGANSGILLASTDGISWNLRTTSILTTGLNAISYFSGASIPYFIGGNSGNLAISSDGIIWTRRTSGTSLYIGGFAYKSGSPAEYLLSGGGGLVATSTDTIAWTIRTAGNVSNSNGAIFYNNQYYVTIGGSVITSTNGIQWSTRTVPGSGTVTLYTTYTDGSNLITHGASGRIITSTNGIQWTLRTSGFGSTDILGSTYANGIYIAGGRSATLATSTDFITWTSRDSSFGSTQINGIIYGNNIYVIGGPSGTITTSTKSILSNYGQSAYFSTSTDSIIWTLRTIGLNTQNITALTSRSGLYVAGFYNSISQSGITVSTDNITWTFRTSGFNSYINNIIYDGTNYIVGANSGVLAVSTDTITWSLRTSGTTFTINQLLYVSGTPNTYLLCGYNPTASGGTLSYSTDTITWTLRTSGLGTLAAFSVNYNSGIYMLGGAAGRAFSSTDTITWTLRTSNYPNNGIYGMVYGLNGWVAGGTGSATNNGAISVAPNPSGFSGGGGGAGASVAWKIQKYNISSFTVNVGGGGTVGNPGAATTISWTGSGGTYRLTVNGGNSGTNVYNQPTGSILGGSGASVPSLSSNYLESNPGTNGGNGTVFSAIPTTSSGTDATSGFQATGGGGGGLTGVGGSSGGSINYYNNSIFSSADTNSISISGLSYGAGGGGGSAGLNGGVGVKGGGGGGGGFDANTNTAGIGGTGGDGYVRISWQ